MDIHHGNLSVPDTHRDPRMTADVATGYVNIKMFEWNYTNVDITDVTAVTDMEDTYMVEGTALDAHKQETRFSWAVWVERRADGSRFVYGEW